MLAERAAAWPKQWKAEGYQEGQLKALAETLVVLAEEKFGSLEARFTGLIAEASRDQLKRWLKNILKATSPEEVFRS